MTDINWKISEITVSPEELQIILADTINFPKCLRHQGHKVWIDKSRLSCGIVAPGADLFNYIYNHGDEFEDYILIATR